MTVVGARDATGAFGAVETSALRSADRLVTEVRVADVRISHGNEQCADRVVSKQLVVRQQRKVVVHGRLLSSTAEEPAMNDHRTTSANGGITRLQPK